MDAKARLAELEEQLEFWTGNIFVEKVICDNAEVIDSYIKAINEILEEIRHLKVIE
jgi:hypothetical protein